MTWGKIHGSVTWHAKVLAAGDTAFGVWARLLGHCASQLTDGFVALPVASAVAAQSPGSLDALVRAGLLEVVDGGYQLHDYLEHNSSKRDIAASREASRERMAKTRASRKPHSSSGCTATPPATSRATNAATPRATFAERSFALEEEVDKKTSSSSRERVKDEQPLPAGAAFDVLGEITRGATQGGRKGAWDYRGDARTVAALVRALAGLQRSKEEVFNLGRYLASEEATQELKARTFSPRWFVVYTADGADASRVERACLLAAEWAAKREAASTPVVAAHRPAVIEQPGAPLLTPEQIKQRGAKWREAEAKARAERGEGGDDE